MKKVGIVILFACIQLVLSGCSSSGGDDASHEPAAATEAASTTDATTADATATDGARKASALRITHLADGTTFEDHTAEVACAHCVYHLDGVGACAPAVKINDVVMLMNGADDLHGLCEAPLEATIAGKVEGGEFTATAIALKH